ncbi:hypothetical protein DUI87_19322 [Hirundo rustica rustica]|uniref:RNase H type-1 domain-containing protein n=1 Tax=Hirundo rustica rustica TaxID=333673 RepID=A0A3M0JTC1_HIRRU|nr:hypothetical protein DUI87_19322 [Hirundo rustica rustica]
MHIPEYSQIVSPLYLVTCKKNDFHWGPEQQQAFAQIKQEIAHAVALGPVRTRPESKWIALITQRACIGNPNRPEILEIITNWPESENFSLMDEEEQEQVTRAEEAPPYNQLPAEETRYALFTDGSCRIIEMKRKWKAAVWSPTRQVAQATEGEGGSSQLAELKAVQLALDIAEREKWPKLYLYTDSWMVANALWG